MKRSRVLLIIMLLNIVSLRASLNAQVLTVPLVIQEQTNWCWAASSKCVLDYFGYINAQCTIAEYTRTVATWHNFGTVNCCVDPTQGCNYWNYMYGTAGSIGDILIHFGNLYTNYIQTYLTISEIQTEMAAGRPFIFRWGWYSGGGHFLVGHGISGTDMYYMNPLPGYGYEISNYYWVLDDGSSHTWTHTQTLCIPSQPGTISGNTSVCQGSSQTYSITPVSGATSYTWTLPTSWSGSSTSTSITATVGSSGGTISVTANNSCGSTLPQTLPVIVNPTPSQPGNISGNTSVCQGSSQTYSINPVPGATNYTWSLPPDWLGNSTSTSIIATVGSSGGTISVTANNSCGSSTAQTLPVTIFIVDTSVTVNGSTLISNANPATYQWITCPAMQIINGETNQTYSPSQNGSYAVIVTQNSCLDTSGCHTIIVTNLIYTDNSINIVIYPNPTYDLLTIKGTGLSNDNNNIILTNALGQKLYEQDLKTISNNIETHFEFKKSSSGMYFLIFSSSDIHKVFKVQKQ